MFHKARNASMFNKNNEAPGDAWVARQINVTRGNCARHSVRWGAFGAILLFAVLTPILAKIPRKGELTLFSSDMTFHMGTHIRAFAVSPDGRLIVGSTFSRHVPAIDVKSGRISSLDLGAHQQGAEAAFSPDGKALAFGVTTGDDAGLQIWDTDSLRLRKSIPLERGTRITFFLFAPDGRRVYIARFGRSGGIQGVDIRTAEVKSEFGPGRHGATAIDWDHEGVELLAVTHDGRQLVIGSWNRVRVWDLQTANEDYSCELGTEISCMCAAVSPDGSQLATAGDIVEVWDFHTGRRIAQASKEIRGTPMSLAFSPDGNILIAGVNRGKEEPGYLVVWRVTDYSHGVVVPCHKFPLAGVSFIAGTNRVVTGSQHGDVSIWDLDRLPWPKGTTMNDMKRGHEKGHSSGVTVPGTVYTIIDRTE
jgi:WD40 repeat protein